MPFPTSDEIEAFSTWLKISDLEREIHQIDPSIPFESGGHPNMVMTPAPPGRVVAGIVKFRYWLGWCVMAPGWGPPIPWPLASETADVARCFIGRLEQSRGGVMPTPWRWGEGARTVAVELADRLADRGLDVVFVADANRTVMAGVGAQPDVRHVPTALGPVVRFNSESLAAMYSKRPSLGWVLDVEWNGRALRLPLELPADDGAVPASKLADRLADAAVLFLVERVAETKQSAFELSLLDESSPQAEVAAWLRRCGLPAQLTRLGDGRTGVESPGLDVIIHQLSRPVGAPAIQAGFGVATVEGRAPTVFSSSGYTRAAVSFAEQAGIALWTMAAPGRAPVAVTTSSKGLKPVVVNSFCGEPDVEDL